MRKNFGGLVLLEDAEPRPERPPAESDRIRLNVNMDGGSYRLAKRILASKGLSISDGTRLGLGVIAAALESDSELVLRKTGQRDQRFVLEAT
jgi:hypothetical protein